VEGRKKRRVLFLSLSYMKEKKNRRGRGEGDINTEEREGVMGLK
jgi:hypothetical protein